MLVLSCCRASFSSVSRDFRPVQFAVSFGPQQSQLMDVCTHEQAKIDSKALATRPSQGTSSNPDDIVAGHVHRAQITRDTNGEKHVYTI